MAMRETVGSMRVYFILAGMLGALSSGRELFGPGGNWLSRTFELAEVALGLAFIYIGFQLSRLVASGSPLVLRVLRAAAVILGLVALLGGFALLRGSLEGAGLVAYAGLGLLITWYLARNFKRLSAQTRDPVPSPRPLEERK